MTGDTEIGNTGTGNTGARRPLPDGSLGPLTVVVVNYQGEEHLGPCLAGIAAQTRAIDELIVVDNASTDGSLALVRERAPHARIVELDANEGPCPARNAGLERARNPWVVLVDNDAVLTPDVLEKLERAALSDREAVLIQPRSVYADEPDRVHYDGGALHYAGLFSLRNFGVPVRTAMQSASGDLFSSKCSVFHCGSIHCQDWNPRSPESPVARRT